MTPETYRRAGELFSRLGQLSVSERSAALDSACAGNIELRTQVLRLLEADRHAADEFFLEGQALEDAARLIPSHPELPSPGAVIGNYRLGSRIGAGGMGVVFEGQDLRLQRRVAVKILPLPLTGNDPEQVNRFQREARAALLLNHPNIVSIFDAGFDQGYYYIATEFVDGKTLRQLIASFDSQSRNCQTILDIVAQTASALSAAHRAGIVHRDVKPENIMLRPDGIVKVLDFGLAKLREQAGKPADMFSDLRSRPGQLAGTMQYLSPEQIAGQPADARSDLFSLGVVAYEVATGIRPFDGPTDGSIYDAILHHSPAPPSSIRPELGGELDRLILRALEKDPELRFQTADDLRSASRVLLRDSAPGIVIPARSRAHRGRLGIAAASGIGLACASAALFGYLAFHPKAARELSAPFEFTRLTDTSGEERSPSLSPDGKQFVYASDTGGKWDIYQQRTGGSASINLTRDSSASNTQPALSRDGSRIVFRSERDGGGLFVMETTGENPRRITHRGYLPAWAPDGKHVVYCTQTFENPSANGSPSSLYVVDIADNSERKLETGDAIQPNWSPHGNRIAYWGLSDGGGRRDIFTVAASGTGPQVAVTADPAVDWNPVWSPSGSQLYFLSDRGGAMNVWRVPIEERSGRTLGPPEPVTVPAQYVGDLSLGGDGHQLIYSQASHRIGLARIGFDLDRKLVSGPPEPLGDGHAVANFSLSPDGSKLVYDTIGDTSENLWIMNADGSGRRRLTSDTYRNRSPAWSPIGDEIAFFSDRAGLYDEWIIRSDGSGLRPLTTGTHPPMQNAAWSPDGKRLLAGRSGTTPLMLDAQAGHAVSNPQEAAGLEGVPAVFFRVWSNGPDGDLAIGDLLSGPTAPEMVIYSPSKKRLEHTGITGREGYWFPGGARVPPHRYFLFARGPDCLLYDRVLKRQTRLFSVAPHRVYDLGVTPDGRQIYFSQTVRDADLWLARLK